MNRLSALARLTAALLCATSNLAAAQTLTTVAAQPFCETADKLQEYVQALIAKDAQWLRAIDGCGSYNAGLKLAVIEKAGWVVKARLFTSGGKSIVGYTLIPE